MLMSGIFISNQLPAFVWSEEYQRELFSRHFKAFDFLRKKGWFIGEFIWNFADFKTNQCNSFLIILLDCISG